MQQSVQQIASDITQFGHHTTSQGEQWVLIVVPNFRRSNFPTANQYVSSTGRILANDGTVTEAKYDYKRVSVPTKSLESDVFGASESWFIHYVVCFTFHGPPPTPQHTVDHVNRLHFDNRVPNLRWASDAEQLSNRERMHFEVRCGEQIVNDLKTLAAITGRSQSTLRGMIKQEASEDFQVLKRTFSTIEPALVITPMKRNRTYPHKEVFKDFVNCRMSCYDISKQRNLTVNTVITYVLKCARETSNDQRQQFYKRVGLNQTSHSAITQSVETFKNSNPTTEAWAANRVNLYTGPLHADPPLRDEEYRLVQGTYKLWTTSPTSTSSSSTTGSFGSTEQHAYTASALRYCS